MILWHCLPIFQVTFLCSLLLFWICLYHGIRVNERRFIPFYLPKFIIVGRFRYPISYLAYCLQFPLFSSINSFSLPSLPPSISHHFCFILIFHPFNRDPLPFLPFFIPSSFYSSVLSLLSLHLFFPPPSALFLPRYIRWPFSTISPLSLSILRPSLVGGLYSLHLASEQLSPRSHLLHRRRLWQLSRLQNFLLCRRSVEVFASYVAVSILKQMKELLETFICSTQIVVI